MGPAGPRLIRYRKDTPQAQRRRNGYRQLRETMVGGRRKYYSMSAEERSRINRKAIKLYDLGASQLRAMQAEPILNEGFVYVVSNPAWPEYVKVGRAFDPVERTRAFQTSGPHRDYKLEYAVYFEDCRKAEQLVHDTLADYRAEGEWFRLLPKVAEGVLDEMGGYI